MDNWTLLGSTALTAGIGGIMGASMELALTLAEKKAYRKRPWIPRELAEDIRKFVQDRDRKEINRAFIFGLVAEYFAYSQYDLMDSLQVGLLATATAYVGIQYGAAGVSRRESRAYAAPQHELAFAEILGCYKDALLADDEEDAREYLGSVRRFRAFMLGEQPRFALETRLDGLIERAGSYPDLAQQYELGLTLGEEMPSAHLTEGNGPGGIILTPNGRYVHAWDVSDLQMRAGEEEFKTPPCIATHPWGGSLRQLMDCAEPYVDKNMVILAAAPSNPDLDAIAEGCEMYSLLREMQSPA